MLVATILHQMDGRRSTLLSIAGLLALTFVMFGDLLFAGGTRVVGDQGADLRLQYFSWRDFGFGELAKGNLALWNPYIFGGGPFFGGMQSALLYPVNWLFLILPLAVAINWTIAINVFAIGAFMFAWMRVRGLSPVASFFAGALLMFSGPYFLHVFAGHLPQMAAMTCSPLIFCAIDGLFKTRRVGWCLLGMFAVAMQILAGFPQYVFYTGIIAGFYAALRLISQWNWRLAAELLLIYFGGAALTAVQLLPAIQATGETVRSVAVPLNFAAQCSLPPENFFTLIAPGVLGDPASYWGRCYLWETSLFFGVTGFFVALYGTIYLDRKAKWIPLLIIIVAFLLALGAHTPLFAFLYARAPGFDRFRVTARFSFPATLFLILLAAMALDHLFERPKPQPGFIVGLIGAALTLSGVGIWAAYTGSWQLFINSARSTHETYLMPQLYSSAEFLAQAQHRAAISIFLAAGTCALIAILLALRQRDVRALYAIVVLSIVEMCLFARAARPTFDSASIVDSREKTFLDDHPGDYRIIRPLNPNIAMSLRVPDIWGYDPNVVRRYAEFITWTQDRDPNNATLYVKFTHFDPLYAMLRLRYVFAQRADQFEAVESPVAPLPHLQLISNYRVLQDRDAIFAAMRSDGFDPAREVILESEPEPKPGPDENPRAAKIVAESTDALTIEADVDQPSILLITDVYTPAWRAVSLPGSSQSKYRVQPADYILRAVPLAAGHHRLRLEYAPREFEIGRWISIAGAVLFFGGAAWCWRRKSS